MLSLKRFREEKRRSRSRTQPQEPLLQEVGVLWGYLEDEIGLI